MTSKISAFKTKSPDPITLKTKNKIYAVRLLKITLINLEKD